MKLNSQLLKAMAVGLVIGGAATGCVDALDGVRPESQTKCTDKCYDGDRCTVHRNDGDDCPGCGMG